jgi:hypothetical protein
VPGLMNLDKAVFTFSEVAYSEGHKLADLCWLLCTFLLKWKSDWLKDGGYWLLLWGGIVQSVPCNGDNFLTYFTPRPSSNHFWFIYPSSLL